MKRIYLKRIISFVLLLTLFVPTLALLGKVEKASAAEVDSGFPEFKDDIEITEFSALKEITAVEEAVCLMWYPLETTLAPEVWAASRDYLGVYYSTQTQEWAVRVIILKSNENVRDLERIFCNLESNTQGLLTTDMWYKASREDIEKLPTKYSEETRGCTITEVVLFNILFGLGQISSKIRVRISAGDQEPLTYNFKGIAECITTIVKNLNATKENGSTVSAKWTEMTAYIGIQDLNEILRFLGGSANKLSMTSDRSMEQIWIQCDRQGGILSVWQDDEGLGSRVDFGGDNITSNESTEELTPALVSLASSELDKKVYMQSRYQQHSRLSKDWCPYVWFYVTRLDSFVNDKSIEQVQEEITEQIKKELEEQLEGITTQTSLYERYAFLIKNYGSSGAKTIEDYAPFVDMSVDDIYNRSGKCETFSSTGTSKSLTQEEYLRLLTYLRIVTKMSLNSSLQSAPSYEKVFLTTIKDPQTISVNLSSNTVKEYKDSADSAVVEYDGKSFSLITFRTIMKHIDSIVKYISPQLYGVPIEDPTTFVEGSDSSQFVNEGAVAYSEALSLLTPHLSADAYQQSNWSEPLPKMERVYKLADITDTSDENMSMALRAYEDLMYIYTLIVRYSYDSDLSQLEPILDEEGRTTGYQFKENWNTFLKQCEAGNYDDATSFSEIIEIYIAIGNTLDYLGITPRVGTPLAMIKEKYALLAGTEVKEIIKEYVSTDKDPLGILFQTTSNGGALSTDYLKGVELSASYIPLKTNLYDTSSVRVLENDDPDWITRFHYGLGFYRKALYIDSNVNAAVDKYVKGTTQGDLRIATLQDMLEPERDIVLYVDDNFYNVDDLAELQNKAYSKVTNVSETEGSKSQDGTFLSAITNWFDELRSLDIESIVKTGSKVTYSSNVYYTEGVRGTWGDTSKVQDLRYILSNAQIKKYMTVDANLEEEAECEYSVMQSFAVVSAIYRGNFYKKIQNQCLNPTPVFVSSPNLAATVGVTQEQWNSIYGYMMLKNIDSALGIDYKTTLDLSSPLFIDIYGNIVTENGLVVIPAASNPSLYSSSKYSIYSTGFLYLYENGDYQLPASYNNSEKFMANSNQGKFVVDKETGTWVIKNQTVMINGDTVNMNLDNLQFNDEITMSTLLTLVGNNLAKGALNFNQHVYLITEVLRGAPIDEIDMEFEGITPAVDVSGFGIWAASKIEELSKSLLDIGNWFLELPNPMFIDGLDYVLAYVFKIGFAVMLLFAMYRAYLDSVDGSLGIRTATSFVVSCILLIVTLFSIPKMMDVSYYQVNKLLLQDEVEYLMMLNLEKESQGREIGLISVDAVETDTTLYIKLDDVSIPWYSTLDKVLALNSIDTLNDAYEFEYSNSPLASVNGVERKGENIYMSTKTLFDSSIIEYDDTTKKLVSKVQGTPYASYVIPYYVILDHLIQQINDYNATHNINNFTYEVQSQGRVRTHGLIKEYLTSDIFMEHINDTLGIKALYGISTNLVQKSPFTAADRNAMRASLWYDDSIGWEAAEYRLDRLNQEARVFITNNRELIGKVSDEVFLKVMALSLAVKHNDIMEISSGNAIEIFDVDARDIIRLAVADRTTVMKHISKSFARFVYSTSGTLGCIFTAILIGVYFLAMILKPLCIIVIIISAIISLVIRRLIKKERANAIEGFIVTIAILCGMNSLYALVLKGSMLLANSGVSIPVSIFLQIVIQFVYLYLLVKFTGLVLSDWKAFGSNKYQVIYQRAASRATRAMASLRSNRMRPRYRQGFGNPMRDYEYSMRRNARFDSGSRRLHLTSRDIYRAMHERDERRRKRRGRR